MNKKTKKLLSFLLALVVASSALPSTALAASSVSKLYIYHTEYVDPNGEGQYEEDGEWETGHAEELGTYTESISANKTMSSLWFSTPDMEAAGENQNTVTPYFIEDGKKYVVKAVAVLPGQAYPTEINADSVVIQADKINEVTYSTLCNAANNQGKVTLYYLWEQTEGKVIPKYFIHYTLNRGTGENQLPASVGVSYAANGNYTVKDEDFKDVSVNEGNTTALYPIGYAPDPGPASEFRTNDVSYGLIGWKCEDPACGTTEDHPLHQVGDAFTATAAAAGSDTTITLSAQWKHTKLPEPKDMAANDSATDKALLKLANPNRGDPIVLTQHVLKDGKPVEGELMLDPATCEVYYEATTWMAEDVAAALGDYIPWGGEKFAQFQIQVQMDPKLTLVDDDGDGYVEFTFTCPFLRPVKGQEVLVNGESVQDVTVTSANTDSKGRDTGPYTYKVPVTALQDENGIHPFTVVVEWNGAQGFKADVLKQPITLATAKATTTSKEDLVTTGTVTGWIDPKGGSITDTAQNGLAESMLANSPTLQKYLTGTEEGQLGLSSAQATQAMLNYMNSEEGHKMCMNRSILTANTVTAWVPCVVEFVDENDETVSVQDKIHASAGDKATEVNLPAPSSDLHFAGWYTAKEGGEAWDFSKPVTSDLKLYARWTPHAYGPWEVTTPATCTEAGVETRTCTDENCKHSETRAISALGHDWGEWVRITEPTYTAAGLDRRTCSRCNANEEREVAQLNPGAANVTITPSTTSLTGGGTVTLTVTGPEGTIVSASPEVTISPNADGTYSVTLPNSTQTYTFTAAFPGNAEFMAASASCDVAVTYRGSSGGGGGGGRPSNPDPGTNIPDPDVPLAPAPGLNATDHFAYVAGYPDGTVRPQADITRAEFATIAARFTSDEEVTAKPFPDTVGHWAEQDIIRAVQAGWIKGNSDGTFRPNDPITRAEAMTLVNRMLERVPDKEHMLSDMVTWPDNPESAWYYEAVQEATNSHDYERDELGVTEIWTAILPNRDWAALETQWANAASGSNGAGDVAENLNQAN